MSEAPQTTDDAVRATAETVGGGGLARIESGEWQDQPLMLDYRAEWLTDVLVERATWASMNSPLPVDPELGGVVIGAEGYVWARFWFRREGWVVEKYFSDQAAVIGFYAPVCGPIEYHGGKLAAELYGLGLWISNTGRVTVLGERDFDADIAEGHVTPVAREQAEVRIRELTTLTAQRRFPPAFVRNFDIITG